MSKIRTTTAAIVDNTGVTDAKQPLARLWRDNFWGEPMGSPASQHQSYRPLTVLTFRWNWQLHGAWPTGFHAVNVAVHALVCAFFVVTLAVLFDGVRAPALPPVALAVAGLLFAGHPVHTGVAPVPCVGSVVCVVV